MKKLLITDLDDTLYDWIGFFIPSFYAMVDEIVHITGIEKELLLQEFKEKHQYYGSVEYPFVTLKLPSILKKYKGLNENDIKSALSEAFQRLNSVQKQKLHLYNGVNETLKELHKRGITIIGYTESSQENGYYRLKRLGISEYFKHVYTYKSKFESKRVVDKKIMTLTTKKPDKDVLLGICERENCKPDEVIYIGDSITKDIYMAKLAGVTSVWVNYPKEKITIMIYSWILQVGRKMILIEKNF